MQVYDRTEFTKYQRFSSVRSRNTEAFEHFICQIFEKKNFTLFFQIFFFKVWKNAIELNGGKLNT